MTLYIHTHTRLTALFPELPRSAGTRKLKPIWILLKQQTVSGSGISWAICKSAPCSRQTTTPAHHHSVFYRPDALPAAQPTASKHWRHIHSTYINGFSNHMTADKKPSERVKCWRTLRSAICFSTALISAGAKPKLPSCISIASSQLDVLYTYTYTCISSSIQATNSAQ